jgi:hypothetical protein
MLILVERSFISCIIAFQSSGLQRIVKEVEGSNTGIFQSAFAAFSSRKLRKAMKTIRHDTETPGGF